MPNVYSEEEERIMLEHYATGDRVWLTRVLRRSWEGIKLKARRMGLWRDKEVIREQLSQAGKGQRWSNDPGCNPLLVHVWGGIDGRLEHYDMSDAEQHEDPMAHHQRMILKYFVK